MKTRVNLLHNFSLLRRIALLTYDHKSYNQYPPFHSVTCPIKLLMSENVVCYCCLNLLTSWSAYIGRKRLRRIPQLGQRIHVEYIYRCSGVIIQVGKISGKLSTFIFYI